MDKSVSSWIQLALIDIANLVQWTAQSPNYAPYDTWNLRWSIRTDFTRIQQWMAIVWSDVAYARRREFENYKNPQNLLYLHRSRADNENQINEIIQKDLSKELN